MQSKDSDLKRLMYAHDRLIQVFTERKFHTVGFVIHFGSYKSLQQYLGLVARKPVFGVRDQARLKPSCSATETSNSEISQVASLAIKLPEQQTT